MEPVSTAGLVALGAKWAWPIIKMIGLFAGARALMGQQKEIKELEIEHAGTMGEAQADLQRELAENTLGAQRETLEFQKQLAASSERKTREHQALMMQTSLLGDFAKTDAAAAEAAFARSQQALIQNTNFTLPPPPAAFPGLVASLRSFMGDVGQ